mgnify:CR=1 FL=1
MKLVIGSDHAGFQYKERMKFYLSEKGYEVNDIGTNNNESCDYPLYAKKLCEVIAGNKADFGILICGTGIGMSMVANKQKGIRAAVCSDLKSVEFTRLHNNANVLCLGERIIDFELAIELVEKFLNTGFIGGKHQDRIEMFE